MKLTITKLAYDNQLHRQVEGEVVFENTKEYKIENGYFMAVQENGDIHAVPQHGIIKFSFTKD